MEKSKLVIAVLLISILICSCGSIKEESQNTDKSEKSDKVSDSDFLINAEWIGSTGACEGEIDFETDGSFSNWCYCGSPVGDGDVVDYYVYDEDKKEILLYNDENILIDIGRIPTK